MANGKLSVWHLKPQCMKRTLYFLRHAKSSWEIGIEDILRPLNKKGQSDAFLMANYASEELIKPDFVGISSAQRTKETAGFFTKAFNIDNLDIEISEALYDFSGESVLRYLKRLDDSKSKVMLVGHNHAFTALVNMLGNKPIDHLPTCGLTVIDFECDYWRSIKKGRTVTVVVPRDFK